MARNKNRRNFSISDRVDELLNEKADEWDMSRSQIVEKAVLEYVDNDRLSRIEDEIGEIKDLLGEGETPSQDDSVEKENPEPDTPSTTSSSKNIEKPVVQRRADDMYERLMNLSPDDIIPEARIEDAIAYVWGDSEHMLEQYTPMIEKRLKADGWKYVETRGLWCATEEAYDNQMESVFNGSSRIINGEHSSRDDIEDELVTIQENKETFTDRGVATEEEIKDLLDIGVRRTTGL